MAFEIADYTIAVVGNHSIFPYLQVLHGSLRHIRYKKLIICDCGLLEDEKRKLKGAEFYDSPVKFYEDNIRVQSETYKKLIAQRPKFILDLCKTEDHILCLDADTLVSHNDFSLLQPEYDLTLTHTHAEWDLKETRPYINLGVMFFNNPKNCVSLIERWIKQTESPNLPNQHFEQGNFIDTVNGGEYVPFTMQWVHCKHFNCFHKDWLRFIPTIIHFRNGGTVRLSGMNDKRSKEMDTNPGENDA